MIKELLDKLLVSQDLSFEESHEMILWIMSEDAIAVKAAAMLALLQVKGITIEEMAGAAQAMRERASFINAPKNSIDTCSTGGNGISTFNISTCAAIIASAAGAVVAKHGNRSNTRKSGSAEALEALGVNLDLELSNVEKCLKDLKICFCYAINHHPAMRFVGPIRKDLGVPTIFNLLGPLTNPAGAKNQLIGVPNKELTLKIAKVLKRLGSNRVLVVNGQDGLCELTVTSFTNISELKDGTIKDYIFDPKDFGYEYIKNEEIIGKDAEYNARAFIELLDAPNNSFQKIVEINSGAAIYLAGISKSLKEGFELAQKTILNKNAKNYFENMIKNQ